MVILSIDYGDVRTGIAVCDKLQMLASPVTVINEKDSDKLVEKIAQIAVDKKAEKLVMGLPRNMDGSYGFRSEACRQMGEKLREKRND